MSEFYKKYRPASLKKVMGNTSSVQVLQQYLDNESLPHTLLFSGPSGCGKTTLARIVRNEMDCHDVDFVEMDCSSFRGIDTIREIMRSMRLTPTGGSCRIWLLDECHQLSKDAQNATLKMLEDTPAHVYFLLCTTDPQKILPTIRTRCTKLPVELLNDKDMSKLVRRVMRREHLTVSDECILDLVEIASGSPRVALVLLDKIALLPEDQHAEALKENAASSEDTYKLLQAVLQKKSWSVVSKILKGLKEDPERVRWAMLGYARGFLLRGKSDHAFDVICAFEEPFYNSKHAGLARACYEAICGGNR